jgi:hypothetical protein
MGQIIKSYNSLKCSGLFCNWEHISRSDYGVVSPALLNESNPPYSTYTISVRENNLPSLTGIPKRSLHHILHYLVLQQIKKSKQPTSHSSFSHKRHTHFLFQYHKNFQLVSRLKGTALCLLQTQYAKKPKNPV